MGDALGAPVEFLRRAAILSRHGAGGIREMDAAYGVVGAITDDAQMTLFTAEGLVLAGFYDEDDPGPAGWAAQQRWLATQGEQADPAWTEGGAQGWLKGVAGLHARRAPGMTCLSSLRERRAPGDLRARNDSKGCGGVMRIAPVGLVSDDPYRVGCDLAAQTHGHPLGWLSAGVFAQLIADLMRGTPLRDAAAGVIAEQRSSGCPNETEYPKLRALLARTLELAAGEAPAPEAIAALGEGWVAEEALAIALFCALRHADDFETGVIAAVNHDGDSDSTGAMAGQLLGTMLGEGAIPARWLAALELREVVETIADDLALLGELPLGEIPTDAGFRARYGIAG